MPTPNRPLSQNKYSEQNMQNTSFDEDFGVITNEGLGYDGTSLQRLAADALATKITVSGSYTYIGLAAPGTAQATAKWQCKRIYDDGEGTTVITWADGNPDFDNTSTDLTALTYT